MDPVDCDRKTLNLSERTAAERHPRLQVKAICHFACALLVTASFAGAQLPVPSDGVVPDITGATDKADPSRVYKLAFHARSMADSADAVSPAMIGVGRLINTYRKYGVPADQIQRPLYSMGPASYS